MRMIELSETDKAYLAGIIDGEGCITVLTVAVVMNDKEAVQMLYDAFGGCLFFVKRGNAKWHDSWRWAVKQRKAAVALEAFLPYLRVKDRQAQIALEFISSFTHIGGRATAEQREKQSLLHRQISALNQREVSVRFNSSTSSLSCSSTIPTKLCTVAETE